MDVPLEDLGQSPSLGAQGPRHRDWEPTEVWLPQWSPQCRGSWLVTVRTVGKVASAVALPLLVLQQQPRPQTTSSSAGARVRPNSGSWDCHLPTPTSPRPAWIYGPWAGMPQPPTHPNACQAVATVQQDVPAARVLDAEQTEQVQNLAVRGL